MSPDYFLDRAEMDEIADFLEGASLRSRDAWEQVRLQSFVTARAFGCEAETAEEFMEFPWDAQGDEEQEEVDSEALDRLRRQAKEIEKDLKNGS